MSDIRTLEKQRAAAIAERDRLKSNPDLLALIRAEKARKELAHCESELASLDSEIRYEQQKTLPPVDPRIVDAIRQLADEKVRVAKMVESHGSIERNFLGVQKAWLITNEEKINRHLGILDRAIASLKKLMTSEVGNVDAEIRKIQSTVPVIDASTVKIKTSPGIAEALQ